ncbi:MAG: 7-cyano-7-deazaguanine synthase QueC [Thermoplasmatota archaeon]
MKAVVLLSGGIDSSTTLAVARSEGYRCFALTILYGQRHDKEIEAARKIAKSLEVEGHRIIELPREMFEGSSLTDEDRLPLDRDLGSSADIPSTYVPARNLIFLSIATGWAEVLKADAVFIGATAVDYSGYPDCRPEFLGSFMETARLATRRGVQGDPVEIRAPLAALSKSQIVMKGRSLGIDYSDTWSCYSGGDLPCGRCDSCLYRLKGFSEAGLEDPLEYERGE